MIAARTADKLAETKQECERYTSDVHTVIADVAREDDCREIVSKAVDEFGGVDIVILNAAITPTPRFFTEMVRDQHIKQIDLAPWRLTVLPWNTNGAWLVNNLILLGSCV